MPKLILKFEESTLKEVPIGTHPVTIGRGPDNDIHIDNLAVSTHHAKVYLDAGRVIIEDLNSLNGTFMNNQRITKSFLKMGDKVLIGKHHLVLDDTLGEEPAAPAAPKVAAPKISETVVLDTKSRKELLAQALAAQQAAQAGGAASATAAAPAAPVRTSGTVVQAPQQARPKTAFLVVVAGNTDAREYALTGKLIIIGKSDMATIKLKGWFKPKMAAQITKKDDGFYIGKADKTPNVNGSPIGGPTKLNEGDIIDVAGVKMNFILKD
jgi:pSer/pThr/pTyr-binding forkhead associated (FHA) protein